MTTESHRFTIYLVMVLPLPPQSMLPNQQHAFKPQSVLPSHEHGLLLNPPLCRSLRSLGCPLNMSKHSKLGGLWNT